MTRHCERPKGARQSFRVKPEWIAREIAALPSVARNDVL